MDLDSLLIMECNDSFSWLERFGNKMRNLFVTICLVFVCFGLLVAISGCGGSASALARWKCEGELLPNVEAHAGKDSAEIAEKATEARVLDTAMNKEVITDSPGLVSAAQAFGL